MVFKKMVIPMIVIGSSILSATQPKAVQTKETKPNTFVKQETQSEDYYTLVYRKMIKEHLIREGDVKGLRNLLSGEVKVIMIPVIGKYWSVEDAVLQMTERLKELGREDIGVVSVEGDEQFPGYLLLYRRTTKTGEPENQDVDLLKLEARLNNLDARVTELEKIWPYITRGWIHPDTQKTVRSNNSYLDTISVEVPEFGWREPPVHRNILEVGYQINRDGSPVYHVRGYTSGLLSVILHVGEDEEGKIEIGGGLGIVPGYVRLDVTPIGRFEEVDTTYLGKPIAWKDKRYVFRWKRLRTGVEFSIFLGHTTTGTRWWLDCDLGTGIPYPWEKANLKNTTYTVGFTVYREWIGFGYEFERTPEPKYNSHFQIRITF